jgi:putative zinc finger protein
MSDQWTERLSEYLDGELAPSSRVELEAHLLQCAECEAALADIRRVVGRAGSLADREPVRDLWPGIAQAIGATPPGGTKAVPLASTRRARRWSFSLPQLAAASVALALASGGAAWLLHPAASRPAQPQARSPAVIHVGVEPRAARGYDAAVADLERVLAQGRGRLDTTTVKVIERNLATIDSAIAEAERAVESDSANVYLNSHLAATMRRKLELLRQAAAIISAAS